jgi:Family of unknown function (DUF5947)
MSDATDRMQAARPPTLASSRLRQLAQRPRAEARGADVEEHCELCGGSIPSDHRHVLDIPAGELRCACRACSLLFDRPAAAEGNLRLIGDRRLRLVDFELSDLAWEQLRIPVEMAFFFASSKAERVMAFYPGPMGATESLLGLEAWRELEDANPILGAMEPDIEALLVNRARGARQHWLVPIDECYALVGLIRTRWKGLSGGAEVWEGIDGFFAALDRRSKPSRREGSSAHTNAAPAGAAERK